MTVDPKNPDSLDEIRGNYPYRCVCCNRRPVSDTGLRNNIPFCESCLDFRLPLVKEPEFRHDFQIRFQ